jgi:hypothetical protein
MKNKNLLQNPIFIVGLILLVLNDHFLKGYYHNWCTGKLSDFIGLLIFPLFIAYIFPLKSKHIIIIVGLFFIFWKSPYSENFIQFCNQILFFPISRTVDYSDFITLPILLASHYIIQNINNLHFNNFKFSPVLLLVIGGVVFMADTMPLSSYMVVVGGDIHIGKWYKTELSSDEFIQKLKDKNIQVEERNPGRESSRYNVKFYKINNYVLRMNDTLREVTFSMTQGKDKNMIMLNNITFAKRPTDLSTIWGLRRFRKEYKKLLKENLIEEMQ